jgi:CheY-like chemotaxis protein
MAVSSSGCLGLPADDQSAAPQGSRPTRRRILVIDHDAVTRGLLCDHLSALDFDVAAEDNGLSGLARLSGEWDQARFHGLLVELQMPVLGGLAVLQEMSERFPTVPVIAMADAAHVGKLRQAVKLGAREYVIKPFDAELLRRKCMTVFLSDSD